MLVEFSLINKFKPKYNNIEFTQKSTVNSRYFNFKSTCRIIVKLYKEDMFNEYIFVDGTYNDKPIDFYEKNSKLKFEEYSENYNKLLIGDHPNFEII